ncbi:putative quinol monooxygenase [Streptomyces sp. SL13]|uniref:Quinol monooxygenase n=1 Tax=Streptantibioticus silvisoli TaxID=2705255 RepID=A0AA90K7N4_9ACTN|nr:putative quinol monooxygenase [Streptantibioticus silvisoli]MDI5964442.1 putative quinol monooxygenase [Streptantibioticus silvisoli]MDI5969088.1 putative quinol monooxygenase [Streptantibioticus silvisoli]
MAYVVTAKWTVKPGEQEAVATALEALTTASRAEPGNLMYVAHRDPQDPQVFFLYEQYTDEAAFQAHTASEHFQRYVAADALPRLTDRERHFYTTWEF